MLTVALIAIIVLALVFDYSNGFHDAANAIASAISTRALTPRTALIIAAIANLGGALLSTGVRRMPKRAWALSCSRWSPPVTSRTM